MKKLFLRSHLILISGFTIFLFSCSLGSCFEETESYVKASLFNKVLYKISAPDSVSMRGSGLDSIIYKRATSLTIAKIPLNSSADTSAFIIKINAITDTVVFIYSSYPHLISKECGYTFYHHLEVPPLHTKHIIDSISIENANITNLNGENIRIYY